MECEELQFSIMIKKITFLIFFLFFNVHGHTVNASCNSDVVSLDHLSDYSYVLVPGFFNEFIAFYMTEYKNYLLGKGVSKNQILRFNSRSFEYPQVESLRLQKKLNEFSKDKPLIFFAHSKGALETLYMLKDFDLSRVHHVYFIQGPFDGVSSHEIFYESLHKEDSSFLKTIKKIVKRAFFLDRYINFSQGEVRNRVKKSIERSGLLEKLTFIVSETNYENLPIQLKLMGGLYKNYYEVPGDGALLKENQLPRDLDVSRACVLDISGSHDLFVKAAPWKSKRISRIHAFIEYLLVDQVSNRTF